MRHGHGTLFFKSGGHFEGTWIQGRMSGEGSLNWPNENNKRVKFREFFHPHNGAYEGLVDIRDINKRNGWGRQTYLCGAFYEGTWKDGKPHAYGRYTYPDGEALKVKIKQIHYLTGIYAGMVKNGKMFGYGCYTFMDGNEFDGEVKEISYPNEGLEVKYEGLVKNCSVRHGWGQQIYRNVSTLKKIIFPH